MSGNHHFGHVAFHGLKVATEKDGWEGALAGAVGVATAAAMAVGTAGLVLTPLGWALAAGAGGAMGGVGVMKKIKESLRKN
jgi:hypothetical protein